MSIGIGSTWDEDWTMSDVSMARRLNQYAMQVDELKKTARKEVKKEYARGFNEGTVVANRKAIQLYIDDMSDDAKLSLLKQLVESL